MVYGDVNKGLADTKTTLSLRVDVRGTRVLDTIFPFRYTSRKITRTDEVASTTQCHFECFHGARAKMKMYREARESQGFSIQFSLSVTLQEKITRTDEVASKPKCHFECFHGARAKMKMYREARESQGFLIQFSLSVTLQEKITRTDEVASITQCHFE